MQSLAEKFIIFTAVACLKEPYMNKVPQFLRNYATIVEVHISIHK